MAESSTFDQNLYSRQIGAFGTEMMGKLVQMRVFLHGLRGVWNSSINKKI